MLISRTIANIMSAEFLVDKMCNGLLININVAINYTEFIFLKVINILPTD